MTVFSIFKRYFDKIFDNMMKKFTIVAAILLFASPAQAIFGLGKKKDITDKSGESSVFQPNFVAGKQSEDDALYETEDTKKVKNLIMKLAKNSVEDEADKFKEALV